MIYLNNTATSFPKPKVVTDAVIESFKSPPCHSSRTGLDADEEDVFYQCRERLAKLFNFSNPIRIAFSSGSTESLNLAIKGLKLKGSHVVSTAIEHNSVIRPLKTLEAEGEIEVTFVPCNSTGYVEPADIGSAITRNTKAVVVNHCSNVTGTILDLKTISEIAHKYGCYLIVDASQSAGALPIDFDGWELDLLAFTGHKSLFGMPGIGGLLMKEGIDLIPLKTGGTGVKSEVLVQPPELPLYYEAGTPNFPGVVSLNAGVGFVLDTGIENIKNRKSYLVRKMIDSLSEIRDITIINDPEHSSFSNFCFNIEGLVPEEVNYILESSYDMHVRSGLHCAPLLLEALGVYPWGTVRASPSFFTTDEEVDKFIAAIKEIVESFPRKKS
ncbi:MAG: Aminotransferase class V-fold PLP-dependent enzyme [Bacteroidota bacterium]|nr:Aminotransferase class V-fold PLP-dependent enzyme [Bacteroidota bacterium]